MDTEGAEGCVGQGGPALRRRLSSLCQTLSPPAPPQFLSGAAPPQLAAVPRAPSAQPLSRAPAVLHVDRTPERPQAPRTPQRRPRPRRCPLVSVSSRCVLAHGLPAPWHPAEQSGPLLALPVSGRCLCSASWLPFSLSLSCPASPACSPPGPSVSGVAPSDSPPTSRHSVPSVESSVCAPPAPFARVNQAPVWLPAQWTPRRGVKRV